MKSKNIKTMIIFVDFHELDRNCFSFSCSLPNFPAFVFSRSSDSFKTVLSILRRSWKARLLRFRFCAMMTRSAVSLSCSFRWTVSRSSLLFCCWSFEVIGGVGFTNLPSQLNVQRKKECFTADEVCLAAQKEWREPFAGLGLQWPLEVEVAASDCLWPFSPDPPAAPSSCTEHISAAFYLVRSFEYIQKVIHFQE